MASRGKKSGKTASEAAMLSIAVESSWFDTKKGPQFSVKGAVTSIELTPVERRKARFWTVPGTAGKTELSSADATAEPDEDHVICSGAPPAPAQLAAVRASGDWSVFYYEEAGTNVRRHIVFGPGVTTKKTVYPPKDGRFDMLTNPPVAGASVLKTAVTESGVPGPRRYAPREGEPAQPLLWWLACPGSMRDETVELTRAPVRVRAFAGPMNTLPCESTTRFAWCITAEAASVPGPRGSVAVDKGTIVPVVFRANPERPMFPAFVPVVLADVRALSHTGSVLVCDAIVHEPVRGDDAAVGAGEQLPVDAIEHVRGTVALATLVELPTSTTTFPTARVYGGVRVDAGAGPGGIEPVVIVSLCGDIHAGVGDHVSVLAVRKRGGPDADVLYVLKATPTDTSAADAETTRAGVDALKYAITSRLLALCKNGLPPCMGAISVTGVIRSVPGADPPCKVGSPEKDGYGLKFPDGMLAVDDNGELRPLVRTGFVFWKGSTGKQGGLVTIAGSGVQGIDEPAFTTLARELLETPGVEITTTISVYGVDVDMRGTAGAHGGSAASAVMATVKWTDAGASSALYMDDAGMFGLDDLVDGRVSGASGGGAARASDVVYELKNASGNAACTATLTANPALVTALKRWSARRVSVADISKYGAAAAVSGQRISAGAVGAGAYVTGTPPHWMTGELRPADEATADLAVASFTRASPMEAASTVALAGQMGWVPDEQAYVRDSMVFVVFTRAAASSSSGGENEDDDDDEDDQSDDSGPDAKRARKM